MQKNAAQSSPSDQEEQNINETQTAAETRESAADISDKSDKGDFNDGTFSYKIWIYAAATAAAAIVLSVLALKKSLNTVSYTHLDVYKRQGISTAGGTNVC